MCDSEAGMELQPTNHITEFPFMKQGGGDKHNKDVMEVQQQPHERNSSLLIPSFDGLYDKPLSCFGCGIGWFSFIMGFFFPLLWYYATFLFLGNYYLKDPRERDGLAASAIAALIFTVAVLISLLVAFC